MFSLKQINDPIEKEVSVDDVDYTVQISWSKAITL